MFRLSLSVPASFVRRCLTSLALQFPQVLRPLLTSGGSAAPFSTGSGSRRTLPDLPG